jgi:hypothetical protein
MKLTEYEISLLTAFGTISAVFVALFIVIIPAILKKRNERYISKRIISRILKNLHELLRGFFLFNPTKYFIKPGEISYAYDISNTKLAISLNPNDLLNEAFNALYYLKRKDSIEIIKELKQLEVLFSGLPQHHSFWIERDEKLFELRKKNIW